MVVFMAAAVAAAMAPQAGRANEAEARMAAAVSNYVGKVVKGLREVAEKNPTPKTYRDDMKAFVADTPGLFGASLIDTNFVIRAVFHKRDFLAVGFDLKKVKELDYFWALMREKPAAQLSEPGHGSLIQPRLVAVRYPVLADGKLTGVVSAMLHTDDFLKGVGLDRCSAFKIICLGKPAEQKGELKGDFHEIKLELPSTEWVIQFKE
jgi:hypothetical protein